jgi:hypothetical protein
MNEEFFQTGIYLQNTYLSKDFPSIELPETMTADVLPDFMRRIAMDGAVNDNGWETFMKRFGMIYLTSETIRRHTDGWIFMFVNGEYTGSFQNENDAFGYGNSLGVRFHLHDMYLPLLEK